MNISSVKDELRLYILHVINESADPEKTGNVLIEIMQRISAGEDPASIEERYKLEMEEIRIKIKSSKLCSSL